MAKKKRSDGGAYKEWSASMLQRRTSLVNRAEEVYRLYDTKNNSYVEIKVDMIRYTDVDIHVVDKGTFECKCLSELDDNEWDVLTLASTVVAQWKAGKLKSLPSELPIV